VEHLDHAAARALVKTLRDLVRANSKFVYTEQIVPGKTTTMTVLTKNADIDVVTRGQRQYLDIGLSRTKVALVPITKRGSVPTEDRKAQHLVAQYEVRGNTVRFHGEGILTVVKMSFEFS